MIFRQDQGNKLTDILDTGWPGLFLISDHLKTILEDNQLTGWLTYSINLYDKKKREINNYHGFSVIGICGQISYKDSKIIEKRRIAEGPTSRYYKGLSIGLNEWNGCDFFTPNDSYRTIITEKTANILKKEKITNLFLENISEIEIPVRIITGHE